MKPARIALIAVLLLAPVGVALGIERFPPPDLGPDYVQPVTKYPGPSAVVYEYVDLCVLVVALGLASWLALRKRSRRWLFVLMVAALAYFGFWRKGCICPVGSVQNVTLGLLGSGYVVPLVVVAFFALPLAFALFFGRTFCAAVCPLGVIQDAVLLHPVRVPRWLEAGLRLLAYAYLGVAVLFAATGAAFLVCQYDPFVAFFRLSGSTSMVVLGACVLLIGVFVGRPYCRFLCPYGVVLGWLSRLSRWRVTITPDECIQCRLCEDACPFGAIRDPVDPPPASERAASKRRLGWTLLVLPVLVVAGILVGGLAAPALSRMHSRTRLAELVWLEGSGEASDRSGWTKRQVDAVEAFARTGRLADDLYAEARSLRAQFAFGGRALGAFLGLVVGLRLVGLSVQRRQPDYEADRGSCLACGRCFQYCPIERRRLKKLAHE